MNLTAININLGSPLFLDVGLLSSFSFFGRCLVPASLLLTPHLPEGQPPGTVLLSWETILNVVFVQSLTSYRAKQAESWIFHIY